MPYESWQELREARRAAKSVTKAQRAMAAIAGVRLAPGTPAIVAAAILRAALSRDLGLREPVEPTDNQLELIRDLAGEAGVRAPKPSSDSEVSAWVAYLRAERRTKRLGEIQLSAGDVVRRIEDPEDVEEVASLGVDGTIYLRGRGRAWPDTVEVAARRDDHSPEADELRRRAQDRAVSRERLGFWSAARRADLAPFLITDRPDNDDLEELERVLDAAWDEKPLQRFLAECPQILSTLLVGPEIYVLNQVQFGREYVADFVIADVDSRGVRWVLVEFESPTANVALTGEKQLTREVRKGISQVEEWRQWLQDNLAYARQRRKAHGLGLFEIRPDTDGLVLVGRRHRGPTGARVRSQIWERSRIHVHTYDWLVETARASTAFYGPTGANPHTLPRRS